MSFNKPFLVLTVKPTGVQEPQTLSYPLSYSKAVHVAMTVAPQQVRDLRNDFRDEFPQCFCCQLLVRDMSLKPYLQSPAMFSVFLFASLHGSLKL